ncbi:trypsin iota [Drosophila sulfurigaster albostrigata]|uniref:trypsin iota n=1 Tax=Drosophila sulfurigaster albostrigata TaxID=89887 RepID=UPI002D218E05|nr:trypsin iota [Drosophila sulfurigaster albostrigata]
MVYRFIVLFILLWCSCSNAIPATTGNGRIMGGSEESIYNAPWQVSIQVSARHVCGGAIYSKDIIITAAHCVQDTSVTLMQVRVGANYHNSGGRLIPVGAYMIHEQYNKQFKYFDIALIRLATQLTYSLSVKAIGLATVSPTAGASVSVSGWGYLQPNGADGFASSLQVVQLNVIERNECASAKYGYGWDFVGDEMICAAAPNKDACTGDSGGPMVSEKLLAGIIAWGYGCGQLNYPGVYVDVAVLRPWIIKTANSI